MLPEDLLSRFDAGGAKETVIDGKTGVFFKQQTPESIVKAIEEFESLTLESPKLAKSRGKI